MTTDTVAPSRFSSETADRCAVCGGTIRVHGDCIACTDLVPRHRYLVVAPETASSPELKDLLHEMAASNSQSTFVLLVPALEQSHLLVWEPGEPAQIAQRKAEEAQALLRRARINVIDTVVGSPSVAQAITDELRAHPGAYDGVILCTLPPGASRWIGLDAACGPQTKLDVPLYRVTGGAALR
jgi:hypothetical protein